MKKQVSEHKVNTPLEMTKKLVESKGIKNIALKHSFQFKTFKLDQLSLVNTANNTNDMTKFSLLENVTLKSYLISLEDKIKQLGLLPSEDRKHFEKLSNLPINEKTEFESTHELLFALQMKQVGFPFRYGIKTSYHNEKDQSTFIDFEIYTNEGPVYVVLSETCRHSSYFSCNNLAKYRRPRLQIKHALNIKKNHQYPIFIIDIDKTLKSFYLDINQLIWEFDPSADVLSFDECIDAMNSIISPATENTVH
jgi:hypothetical protein